MVVHGGALAGGLVLVAKALRPANRVSVYAAISRSSRWCYGYILVRRGGRVRKWWLRHDGRVLCYGFQGLGGGLSQKTHRVALAAFGGGAVVKGRDGGLEGG